MNFLCPTNSVCRDVDKGETYELKFVGLLILKNLRRNQ